MSEREKIVSKEKKKALPAWENFDVVGHAAVGRRKTAVARVWLRRGTGKVFVNRSAFATTRPLFAQRLLAPLRKVKMEGQLDVHVYTRGGGPSAQIDAMAHGISRALLKMNTDYRALLKPEGFLTRDSREKERKKYFHKRARKSTQFRKR